jgi:hydrogenase maturation protease
MSHVTTVKVLGLGNVLMGDDGVGPYVVQVLDATYACPERVSFVEVGTPGLDLIPCIDDADILVIVDTVRAAGCPGEIRLYDRDSLLAQRPQPRLSPHDPGLKEALATLLLSGRGPGDALLVGLIPEPVTTGIGLSPAVRAAVPAAVDTVVRELARRNVRLERREPEGVPDIWWERTRERPATSGATPRCTR